MGLESDTAVADEIEVLESEQAEQNQATETPPEEAEQIEISIGGESPAQTEEEEKPHIRDLRERYKGSTRRVRELEEQLAKTTKPETPEVGAKPTLESCGYDEDKFEKDLDAWKERARAVAEVQRKKDEAKQADADAFAKRVETYQAAAKALKVPDFAVAEEEVKLKLNATQQGIILHVADKPEHLVYALGKSPKEADRLAAIKDPAKYAYELGKLESKMTVTKRTAPAPETKVVGSAARVSEDKELARLEAIAEKTGNRTDVVRYKKSLKAKT